MDTQSTVASNGLVSLKCELKTLSADSGSQFSESDSDESMEDLISAIDDETEVPKEEVQEYLSAPSTTTEASFEAHSAVPSSAPVVSTTENVAEKDSLFSSSSDSDR